jgi:hypothetical protein
MIKRLLLLTAIFGFAVSCNDYEDDFANLNDQLNGVNAKLDNIQTAVDGIAGVQLELLNINSALAAISSSIAELPTVDDITGIANLINSTSTSLAAQMDDLDADLQAVAASIIAQLDAMEDMIENGFLAVNTSLTAISANIQIIDGEISVIQTTVDANGNLISANGTKLIDLASAVTIVDGKIVAVDGKLDTVLSDLTGQLATMLTDITAQFTAVTGAMDANQAEALIWYLNTMTGIGRVEVDLAAIDAQNAAILQQLASMLTVVQNGFATQSTELSEAEVAILAEITLVQQSLATTLLEIAGLETLVNAIQSSVNANDTSVDSQLAVINGLIQTLQSDLTTLLESTTTIYQGDLDITNQAELDYALELDNKVMVINGNVEINSTFATGGALTNLNSVITKMVTITGDVTVTSTSDLDMDSLNSVGGDYSVTGKNITDSALITVGENATFSYGTESYIESNLVNVGGTLTITDNGSATVNFSGVTTAGGFAVSDGAAVTDVLTDVDTISLGAGIVDADITNALTLNLTADTTDAISIATSTSIVITGDTFDVDDVTISAAGVTSTLEDITGNILVTASGALVFAANNLGVAAVTGGAAAAPISVALSSDGQNVDLNEVVATSFTITDTGATAANFTDLDVVSMTADTFVLTSTTTGANNEITTPNNWNVGSTSMTAKRKILFEAFLDGTGVAACTTGGYVMGDLSITTTGTGAGIETHTGYIDGDLTVSGAGLVQVNTIQDSSIAPTDLDGNGILDDNWYAVDGIRTITSTGNNVSVNHKIITCDAAGAENAAAYSSQVYGAGTLTASGNVVQRVGTHWGTLTIAAGGNVELRGATTFYSSDLIITGGAAGKTIDFAAGSLLAGGIDVDYIGSFDGNNIDGAAYQISDPITISATEGIDLGGYTNLGDSQTATVKYPTTLTTTTGNIDLETITSITGPIVASSTTGNILMNGITAINTSTTLSSTTGDIDLSSVVTIGTAADATATPAVVAAPVDVSVTSTSGDIDLSDLTHVESNDATLDAGTGALAAAVLATHTGTAIALGGSAMELTALASSTGSIDLSGVISTDHTLDALATFVSMTSSVPTMILPVYVSGTFDITSTALTAPSIALADLTADELVTLTLTAQASNIAIGAGDYADLATLALTTNATGLDSIVLDAVDALASATLVGKADVLQVMNNAALTTLNPAALVNKGVAQTGSKVHIINNDVLTSVETGNSKMHELKIMGNALLATIDLTSYLSGGTTANDTVTAADLATVTFILDITGNAITGTLSPVNNAGQQTTGLVSAELAAEAKLIAAHLFGFTQGTVVAQADFVGLQATTNSEDQYNNTTDFSTAGGGINTAAEWALMTAN